MVVVSTVQAQDADGPTEPLPDFENEVVVVFEENVSADATRTAVTGTEGEMIGDESGSIQIVRFEEANGDDVYIEGKVQELSEDPDVVSAEANDFVELHYSPNDTFFRRPQGTANQGNLSLIGMPGAWERSKGNSAGIGIADSGLPSNYGELPASKVLAQKDVLNGDAVADDRAGHGSAIAMVAAAKTDNNFGMAGAGFNAKVAMCKFSTRFADGSIGGTVGDLAKCIDWLQKRPSVDVLNFSLGLKNGKESPAISNEIKQTQERYGKVVVASVGNSGAYVRTQLPASLPGVIGVGSIDSRTARSSFSSYGPMVDLMAPGNNIVTYVIGGQKPVTESGTSYSAPQVAGCAALLSTKGYSADQIRSRLLKNATNMGPAGRDDQTGFGYLNCAKAIAP